MTERETGRDEAERASGPRLKRLLCKRIGQMIEPQEHEKCPYCFGRLAEIEKGRHGDFCDYREGADPVSFGFPSDDWSFDKS